MHEPVTGTLLGGKYLVAGVLGRGGMGVVLSARHVELDQLVAIKCLLPEALEVPNVVERFMREARAAAKIQGEHVVRVLDVGRFDDGIPYIVMEHLQGHDLAVELRRKGQLPTGDAIRYVLEACEAVAQAHALRIVHRDLKPANLFLAEQPGRGPVVKVLDFGISKTVDPSVASLTKTERVMGTPFYMSPEHLLSARDLDERSDIWSLGIILYELVIGSPPFVAETAAEVVAQVLRNQPEAASARRPDLPPGLDAIIARALRSDPGERYANVAQFAEALMPFASRDDRESIQAIARVLGVQRLPSLPPSSTVPIRATAHNLAVSTHMRRGASKKRWGWTATALAALAAAGIVAALAFGSRVTPAPPVPASLVAAPPPVSPVDRPAVSAALATVEPTEPSAALVALDRPIPSASATASAPPSLAPPPVVRMAPSFTVAPPPAASKNPLNLQIK